MPPQRKPGAKGTTKITFSLPKDIQADEAAVCGDFNDWDPDAHPMKKLKDGRFTATVNLSEGKYRYRFLLDGARWENDWEAEAYASNPFGGEDSIITI
ncbi:MAG TPA: isoamylase early set domain-containing protein [Acidimicrobiales bacterium]|jgi:1,4-alpha-glucan branching enzyme|nr:isoamylase early set domain-containing protein [Acidimicrobiales bacterium]